MTKYKYINLIKYPTIGEVIFSDEPNTVYINRYALPRFRYYLQMIYDKPDMSPSNIIQFPTPQHK